MIDCHYTNRLFTVSSGGCHIGVAYNRDGSDEKMIHNFSLKIKRKENLRDLDVDGFNIN